MTLTFATALWGGFAIVVALVGIYLFRTRSQPRTVGSLLLWVEQRRPSEGGRWLQQPQMPLLLALEILIVVLVALAAASPRGVAPGQALPLLVILDDSFSMRAGEPDSPRAQAIRAVEAELAAHPGYQVRLIVAGARAEFLGETCRATAQLRALWPLWKCGSPVGDLDLGVALARETREHSARLLVITDRAPAAPPADGRLQWWAFGRPLDNLAIVNAGRTMFGAKDRFFVEIANLSSQPVRVAGRAETPVTREFSLDIGAFDTRREVFDLESATAPVRVQLPPDALPIDNSMVLVAPQQRPVKTAVRLGGGPLHQLTERALEATGLVMAATGPAELLIRTASEVPPAPGQWVWEFVAASGSEPFLGPFAIDRTSPLAEGLSLSGVIWGAPASGTLRGVPVLLLANAPLVTEERLAQGARRFQVRYDPHLSNFHNTPNWPILFWNLVRWRQSFLPGPAQPNLRLGMEARLQSVPGVPDLRVRTPEGETVPVRSNGEAAVFLPTSPGLHEVENGTATSTFAVNCLARGESDLTRGASGRWGDWTRSEAFRQESLDLGWAFLLPGALLLGLHLFLISVAGGGGPRV